MAAKISRILIPFSTNILFMRTTWGNVRMKINNRTETKSKG